MRVLVVDDHPVFRRGLVALLRASGIDVTAEAASGEEAIAIVDREEPDIVLMDLGMPGIGGVRATAQIHGAHPAVRIVVITQFDDATSVRLALEAGASGYVLKEAEPEQILAALQAAQMGAVWLGSHVPVPATVTPTPAAAPPHGLTAREWAVAELVGRGLTNPAIAQRLGLSTKTVANYLSTVLLKVGASDRLEAARVIRGETPAG